MRRVAVALAGLLLLASPALAASVPLPTRLATALAVPHTEPALSGAVAVDLASGGTVFARNPDTPLQPASNEKVPLTFAALHVLGPSYRFRTELYGSGRLEGTTWRGDLYLKGYGDPTLSAADLLRLGRELERQGIEHVSGRVLGDESWFDSRRVVAGWKSSFFINECSPISALVVDRGVYDGHVAQRPVIAATGTFRRMLRRLRITAGAVGVARAPHGAVLLAAVQSRRLSHVIASMDRDSDNFTAEMLLKELGAEAGTGGNSAAGAAVVVRALRSAEVPVEGVRIVDGSGLSAEDRLTARALAAILVALWNDRVLQPVVWSALPVAGVSGTLRNRLLSGPARGVVRAKTGTTDAASALAGYVRDRYAFVVLENGYPVWVWAARRAEDRFATALARVSATA